MLVALLCFELSGRASTNAYIETAALLLMSRI